MRPRAALPLALALAACCVPGPAAAATAPASQYVVVYRASVRDAGAATDLLSRTVGFETTHRYSHALRGFSARLTPDQVRALRGDPRVALVSPDRPVRAFGSVPVHSGEEVPTGIARSGAARAGSVRPPAAASVAVVDTGIDLTHPDLPNAADGTNCIGTGSAQDDNGHGTHVAGTIGAVNTGSGVVGVAPGTRLYAVKVLDQNGEGSDADVICGFDWVAANASRLGIKVANVSLGGPGTNDGDCGDTDGDPMHQSVCGLAAAGVTPVVSAGNGDENWVGIDFATTSPANFPEALTVTAVADSDGAPGAAGPAPDCDDVESDDHSATFSNFATQSSEIVHTIAGPGVCIFSTWAGGDYGWGTGTSMAAPHVTAATALCFGEQGAAGPCSGLPPSGVIAEMRNEAAAHSQANPGYGFCGDPQHPAAVGYYGYLVWAGTSSTSSPALSCGPLYDLAPSIGGSPQPGGSPPQQSPPPQGASPHRAPKKWPRLHVTVRAARDQHALGRRGLILRVRCDQACTLRTHGRLVLRGRKHVLRMVGGRSLPAGVTVRRRARLTRATARSLQHALRHRQRISATIVLRAARGSKSSAGSRRTTLRR